ncbi:MAG: DUF3634 family protein [Polyangiaceae bacterium]
MTFVLVALGVVAFLYWTWRQNELFLVSVRDGRALVVRGRIPAGLLSDLEDIARRPPVSSGSVRAYKAEGGARVTISGQFDQNQAQRIRNTFSLYPVSRLRVAPKIARPTLGQILGIAWLAWLLNRRG